MAIDRFVGPFKSRTDILDNITPNNVVQPNVSVPAGEWKPAAWLPIVWTGEASKDSFVISSGKVVAFDGEGRIVPAGLALLAAGGTLSYTSADVAHGTIDITTGAPVTAAVTYDEANDGDLAAGLIGRGLLPGGGAFADFISAPIGVAAYDVFAWAGDSAGELNFVNYQKQHLVQFFTDVQLQAPCHAAAEAVVIADNDGRTQASELAADAKLALIYSSAAIDVIPLDDTGAIAAPTARTPITDENGALLKQVSTAEKIRKAGDFFFDAATNTLVVHHDTADLGDITGFVYDGVAGVTGRFVHCAGLPKPGDALSFDADSNFKVAEGVEVVVGRCLAVETQPRGLLDRTRTAWEGASFDKSAQMPGSATAGFTDLITLSDEIVADRVAIINVKVQ